MRTMWFLLVALFAAVFARLGEANGPEKPPNIVLIVLDDIGFEVLNFWPPHLFTPGIMGHPPTPALESLVAGGITFTNAWASPVCSPSRMQVLTGRHAHRTGVGAIVGSHTPLAVDDNELFLPEVIKAENNPSNYRAGAFGKWHLAPLVASGICQLDHPNRNGFDVFQGHMWNVTKNIVTERNHFQWERVDSTAPLANCLDEPPVVTEWSATVTRRDAMDWVASLDQDTPFLAYIAFNAPHTPLQVPPLSMLSVVTQQYIGMTYPGYAAGDFPADADRDCSESPEVYAQNFGRHVEVYNWMVEAVDAEIGKIIRRLGTLGRLDDTVIVVISDNGTAVPSLDCPTNEEHVKGSIYQLGTRVPLIVWGAPVVNQGDEGSVCDELISAVDLWPTIAETAGVVNPGQYLAAGYTLDGVSFSHLIADPAAASLRSYALIENFTGYMKHHDAVPIDFRRSVVAASGYKYVHQFWGDPPMGNGLDELHDLPTDHVELANLATFGAALVNRPTCTANMCVIPWWQRQVVPGLIDVSCTVPADCVVLHDIFDNFYAPLLCWCLATN